MKILYLNLDPGVPVFGAKGASVHVRALAAALARAGVLVRVLTRRAGACAGAPPDYDILETNGAEGPALHKLVERTLDSWRPDAIYERYALGAVEGGAVALARGVPHLLEVNAPLPEEAAQYRGLSDVAGARRSTSLTFRNASRILVVSRALAEYVRGYGIDPERIHLFPNAIDRRLFETTAHADTARHADPRNPLIRHGAENSLTLGFCGALRPWHGIEALAEIFLGVARLVPGARLLIVGDGPGREQLERAAAENGLAGAVEITGPIDHEAVPYHLRRLDVALAPYPPIEPFYFSPLKIFESLAAGVPVIASRQGDIPLLITPGVNGFLYDPEDLRAAILHVLHLHADRDRAREMGRAGQGLVFAHHTWDQRAATVLEWLALPPGVSASGALDLQRVAPKGKAAKRRTGRFEVAS